MLGKTEPPKESNIKSLINEAERYLQLEQIEDHRQHIKKLIADQNERELELLIGKRLKFGTAGIRGSMGPGFGQMNDLVIIQTSQGLASYLLELDSEAITDKGIVVGFDARHNSSRFARLAALAFLEKKIPVFFCEHIVPTPLVAFGVRHFGCSAGVMVTASHNPKNDNGYKVYFADGAQIMSPHDQHIQRHIVMEINQKPWLRAWQHELLKNDSTSLGSKLPQEWQDMFQTIHTDLCKGYYAFVESLVGFRRPINQASNINITYTAMHGVGHIYLTRVLDIAGFEDTFPVDAQKKPDPEFPTVQFPNPEEVGALDLAFETANHANSNLIIANDPDSDRCAVGIFDPSTKYRRVFTGNEVGALLAWWIWHSFKEQDSILDDSKSSSFRDSLGSASADEQPYDCPIKVKKGDCYMISTAVSSKFIASMAKSEGFEFLETLTGFKYIGNIADKLKSEGKTVLFAFEEAIGYMVDSTILDKDGLTAAVQVAQCAAYLNHTLGRNLEQQLDWLYNTYGYHYNLNSYYICRDPAKVRSIFTSLQSKYPKDFGQKFPVKRVRDLNNGYDSGTADKKAELPVSSSSYMLTFYIDSDIVITFRTSGTEPKIKFYSEIQAKLPPVKAAKAIVNNQFNGPKQSEIRKAAQSKLRECLKAAIDKCLMPEANGLQPACGYENQH